MVSTRDVKVSVAQLTAYKKDHEDKKQLTKDLKASEKSRKALATQIERHDEAIGTKDDEIEHQQEEIVGLTKTNEEFTDANSESATDTATMIKEIDDLTKENTDLISANRDLIDETKSLKEALGAALASLKDGGKHCKSEENNAIKKAIQKWVKEVGFRKTKFAKGAKLVSFTQEVYEGIKEKNKLTEKDSANYCTKTDFHRIYEGWVGSQLADRRSYLQTGLMKSIMGE